MLTDNTIATIKSTIPLLEGAGTELTEHFYKRMFSHNPELKHIFNLSHQHSGRQQLALFQAIAAYAKNIENLSALTTAVERIAHKHTSFNIQPDHYTIVGHHLIETLKELAPDEFTQDVQEAWEAAYTYLAEIFITRETQLYQESGEKLGGWKGGRKFRLIEKRIESELVKSLVFEPVDKGPVVDYQPGQYLGIEVTPSNSDYTEIRQYSLSDKPNGRTYRISVKREIIGVPGIVSNYLHDGLRLNDEITLHAPAGDFVLLDKQAPVVLVSAGVGLTPMQSMLETLSSQNYQHPVFYLHACVDKEQHSFIHRLDELVRGGKVSKHIWYQHGREENLSDNTHHGYMDLSLIENELPISNGDFYLCGPVPFMQFAKQQLVTLGVEDSRIHYEVFGPHESF